jgi:hypothetical protein
LQCDQVLKCLKAACGHAIRNALKKHQSLIDGTSIPILETPGSSWFEPITRKSYISPSLDSTPSGSDGEKSMTKSEMLHSQSKKMAIVVSHFSTTS